MAKKVSRATLERLASEIEQLASEHSLEEAKPGDPSDLVSRVLLREREFLEKSEYSLKEAKLGNPTLLTCRVLLRERLSLGEHEFVEKALMATAGKWYAEARREAKQRRMAQQVVALTMDGTKQEAAIEAAMRDHRVSRRQVFHALKVHKKFLREWTEERMNARDYGYEEDKACPWCNRLTLVCTGDGRLKCVTCDDTMDASCAQLRHDVFVCGYERDEACPWCGRLTLMRDGDHLKCVTCGDTMGARRAKAGFKLAPEI